MYIYSKTYNYNFVEYQLDKDPQASIKLFLKLLTGHRIDTCFGIGMPELLHPSGLLLRVPSIPTTNDSSVS